VLLVLVLDQADNVLVGFAALIALVVVVPAAVAILIRQSGQEIN